MPGAMGAAAVRIALAAGSPGVRKPGVTTNPLNRITKRNI